MRISKWHVGEKGKAAPRNKGNTSGDVEAHWILVDGDTYARLESLAEKRKTTVNALVDNAIHRALDAIYLGRGVGRIGAKE